MSATVDVPIKNAGKPAYGWLAFLLLWVICLALFPDPRPLAAPDWAVNSAQRIARLSEPTARLVATLILRVIGVGMIGVLMSVALRDFPTSRLAPILLIGAPAIALLAKSVNFGSLPASPQLEFILIVAILGGLAGLVLRKNWVALAVFGMLAGGMLIWGTATSIPDELDEAARATGQYILDNSDDIPDGNEGFVELMERSFAFAHENSHGHDPIMPNKATILALGVILGEDKVAWVGGRELNEERKQCREKLRNRIRARDRNDLSRHFWVSASLAVLSDSKRSRAVGITKELKDATPGGSGFSFVDMAANKTGIQFAVTATRNQKSAFQLQDYLAQGVALDDVFPQLDGLPEGISADDFQSKYGGLGGGETQRLLRLIEERISALPVYN